MDLVLGIYETSWRLPLWAKLISFLPFFSAGCWHPLYGFALLSGYFGLVVITAILTMGMVLILTAPPLTFATIGACLGVFGYLVRKLIF
jgi:hypothetical protein